MTQHHFPRKRFGQHFLHDKAIIDHIIDAIDPTPLDHLIEIGPGQGVLTAQLVELVKCLEVIELDRDLIPILSQRFAKHAHFKIHEADILKFDISQLTTTPASLRVCGNLPYNISTPLLFHLITAAPWIADMCFMLQLEVVERMAALPNSKTYGRLSIMTQYHYEVTPLFKVPPTAFNPPPQVMSGLVKLVPIRQSTIIATHYETFANVVKLAFNQRRKVLSNSLRAMLSKQQFELLNINPSLRAEQLSLLEYVKISNAISEGIN